MNVLEKIHGGYVHHRRVRVLIQKLSALLPDRGRILDVGCGDGLLSSLLQQNKPNTSITGIDVMVRRATHIPVEQFDGRSIPFADASFDAVIFVDVLHHTDAPMILLREAVRVAREAVVIKDHTKNGLAADATLRFMDRIGNRRYNVPLAVQLLVETEMAGCFRRIESENGYLDKRSWIISVPSRLFFWALSAFHKSAHTARPC